MVRVAAIGNSGSAAADVDLRGLLKNLEREPDNALQRALLARGLRILLKAKSREKSFIEKVLAAPDEGEFLTTIANELSPAEDTEYPAITESLRGGIELRNRLLKEEGGCASAEQTAAMLGLGSRQAIYHQLKRRFLFAVPVGQRGLLFPVWQFKNGHALPGLDRVLAAFQHGDPWAIFLFFLSKSPALGGQRPLDMLRDGQIETVVEAAAAHGQQGGR